MRSFILDRGRNEKRRKGKEKTRKGKKMKGKEKEEKREKKDKTGYTSLAYTHRVSWGMQANR